MTPVADDCPPEIDVVVLGEVEIKNDVGNPVPVSGTVEIENEAGNPITVEVIGEIEVTNDVGAPLAVSDTTAAVEREVDGDIVIGLGTLTIPDGVLSFSATVLEGGFDILDTSDWPTVDGPSFAAPVPLRKGQSISMAADEGHGNTINGPIVIEVPAGAAVNATWMLP